jgi:hypothetical protein
MRHGEHGQPLAAHNLRGRAADGGAAVSARFAEPAPERSGSSSFTPSCPDSGSVWCRQFGYDNAANRTVVSRSPAGANQWGGNPGGNPGTDGTFPATVRPAPRGHVCRRVPRGGTRGQTERFPSPRCSSLPKHFRLSATYINTISSSNSLRRDSQSRELYIFRLSARIRENIQISRIQ